ncbi:MAG TPA: ABC transporter substrate-binding protein [Actinocrinis sp.]|jgi:peptide/nickel transport system substrate-binding protein
MVGAVVAAGALALSACSSSSTGTPKISTNYSFGSIPAQSSSVTKGGTLNWAETAGSGPDWILPITPTADCSVFTINEFQDLSWRPVFFAPTGTNWTVDYSKSMATAKPAVSNGGKTFTISLKSGWKWSDGTPVTAQDVLFAFDVLKAAVKESAANSCAYTPGQFPDNITSMTAPNATTIVATFDKAYNPSWAFEYELAGFLQPLPSNTWNLSSTGGAHISDWNTNPNDAKVIWDYLDAQSSSVSTYATNPLWQQVNGPYKISAYNSSTMGDTFVANTAYTGGAVPDITTINELAYTSNSAEFSDLLTGKLDGGLVDSSDLPQIKTLAKKGYGYYGLPSAGFQDLYYNFDDKTDDFNNVIKQLYVRQAFATAQDEQGEIKGAFDGAGAPSYGPIGVAPSSPYTPANALTNPYPFSIANATKLLTDHGWNVVSGGKTTCTKPGTAADECGAGIKAGQDINFTLYYSTTPSNIKLMDLSWVGNLKQLGVSVNMKSDTFDNITSNENDVSSPDNSQKWGAGDFGGWSGSIYPTTDNILNEGGSYDMGDANIPALNTAINNSIYSSNADAVKTEASIAGQQQPVLFQPNPDFVYAFKNTLSGPTDSFSNLTQFDFTPEDWYFTG